MLDGTAFSLAIERRLITVPFSSMLAKLLFHASFIGLNIMGKGI
jgi:hypothetical protein